MSVKENEKISEGKNNNVKEIDPKVEQAKQKSSENSVNTEAAVGLKEDEVITSTMTGQVVAKKSSDEESKEAGSPIAGQSYDDYVKQMQEGRDIVGGEQMIASGPDKGRPINSDGLPDNSVPPYQEQRFREVSESEKEVK